MTMAGRMVGSVGVCALVLAGAVCGGQEKKIVVGILPTYDISGQSYGGPVSQMLTGMLYQQLAVDTRFRPVFLNPGGLYDPTSTNYTTEYIQGLGMPLDVVLATTFTEPETPKKGDLILHLKAVQMNQKTGDALQTTVANTPLKDRNAMLDYGGTFVHYGQFNTSMVYQPSRDFQKQPLGKASFELAKQTADTLGQGAAKLSASGTVPAHGGAATCKMQMKISYREKHAISKSYTVIVNDKEESLGVKEGILEVEEPASALIIQVKLHDSPYKLPKQDVYLFDPVLDCSRSSNVLDVSIGAAGEASASWR